MPLFEESRHIPFNFDQSLSKGQGTILSAVASVLDWKKVRLVII